MNIWLQVDNKYIGYKKKTKKGRELKYIHEFKKSNNGTFKKAEKNDKLYTSDILSEFVGNIFNERNNYNESFIDQEFKGLSEKEREFQLIYSSNKSEYWQRQPAYENNEFKDFVKLKTERDLRINNAMNIFKKRKNENENRLSNELIERFK